MTHLPCWGSIRAKSHEDAAPAGNEYQSRTRSLRNYRAKENAMLNTETVSNLISKYNQPFTPKMLAGMLDSDIQEVEHLLGDLAKADKVRCISPSNSLYVRANRHTQGMAPDPRCKWNYNIQIAMKLLDLIESKSYRSVRELTKDFGRSRQFVFVYLEALASISIIGMNPHGY